jgi:hypothetical protein
MASNIILNKTHIQNLGNGNNVLRYDLPKSVEFGEEDTVSLSNLNIYYSWFNITSRFNNNRFFYKWYNDVDGTPDVLTEIVIDDGWYSTLTLNEAILQKMTKNGHYLESIDGKTFLYFMELKSNQTFYATSVILSSVSQQYDFHDGNGLVDIGTQYKTPTGWKLPATFKAPEFIFPSNNNFYKLLGFSAGATLSIYTSTDTTQRSETFLNTQTPAMLPNSSYIMTCNLVSNDLSIPNDVMYSFTIPNNTGFGDLIGIHPDAIKCKIKAGVYNYMEVRFYNAGDFSNL